jgi:nitric-oxide synthase
MPTGSTRLEQPVDECHYPLISIRTDGGYGLPPAELGWPAVTALSEDVEVIARLPSTRLPPTPSATSCPITGHTAETPPGRTAPPTTAVDLVEAEEFLRLYHHEHPGAGPVEPRLALMHAEVAATGSYRHTTAELAFGARVAWRNSARCIGRLYWRSLQVRDLRHVRRATDIAAECAEHLRVATNGGKVRPVISVFAPDAVGEPGPRIWNEQLIRYAGYRNADGTVLGDPRYVEFTSVVRALGWAAPATPGRFDVLPLVVETATEGPVLADLPRDVLLEVPLCHPELAWFAELGLRWHAVPAISNMRLRIGGIDYPAAPFNGWYMGTEIGARNLADGDRYDLVRTVAERLGMDCGNDRTLWRDRALVELNLAVLHSFDVAGVTIADHHTESHRFLQHLHREERAGRRCPADWSWIVPPMSSAQTPVFHRYYDEAEQLPGYVTDPDATARALTGSPPAFPQSPSHRPPTVQRRRRRVRRFR